MNGKTVSKWKYYLSCLTKSEKRFRFLLLLLFFTFALATLVWTYLTGQFPLLRLPITTLFLVFVPVLVEWLFAAKMTNSMFLLSMIYVVSPMIGENFHLYHYTHWWDKLLHTGGGILFGLFGAYLFDLLTKRKDKPIATAIFALCFSIALSAVWELIEFASDTFFHTDMQKDSVITEIHSYSLDDDPTLLTTLENIKEVTVNGEKLRVNGYLDVGLIDTMRDMLVETIGAFAVAAYVLVDKNEHMPFAPLSERTDGGP